MDAKMVQSRTLRAVLSTWSIFLHFYGSWGWKTMSDKKKTRPAGDTAGRVVETGSASRADTTSNHDSTTSIPRAQAKIADLLLPGRENAIPRRERREGRPILADNAIPATEYERAAFVRHRAAEAIDRAGV
ncbi:hypothetical protein HMPREF0372_01353 [Flavonifractor plautii ATCC 29863]|uniref:Uncharacterized protein n=2 Tax=Flavonifractor plautii TaxID=292800 RepID=G9YPB5_FLAPL|nr:hypothetical protein HMPREF0372_01353 [Flavonifractor plautii ATCC 29863]